VDTLKYGLARLPQFASREEWYTAVALTVRGHTVSHWRRLSQHLSRKDGRVVAYLSAEFLLGPHLANHILNEGIEEPLRAALFELGQDLDDLIATEEEPGLGNGGLGRLAACYLDSLATLQVPALGYGIRYEFGIFDQRISNGWQVELTDHWLRYGNPWEIPRPQVNYPVGFGGHTETYTDQTGHHRDRWIPERMVKGVAYDTPITGYRVPFANRLRLWKAEAHESFDFDAFNIGNYYGAVEKKIASETISKVLYPNDEQLQGKILRLEQQYFFVSCSLQDMLRLHLVRGSAIGDFDQCWAIQLNDTHPSLAVAELMRLLIDEHNLSWEQAWQITSNTFAYTNHTLMPEALERWAVPTLGTLLPRHLQIIFEINHRFLKQVQTRFPGDADRARRMSLIDEDGPKYVRMAHLATVGSHHVNGVAEIHTELLKRYVLHDFVEMWPHKLVNVTNGVTPRRWIALANPKLAELISSKVGDAWLAHAETDLIWVEAAADDPEFLNNWSRIHLDCKRRLAHLVERYSGVTFDPATLVDIQVKRIHEYKRQHLNVLHIITLYNRLRRDPGLDMVPRTFLFGGKAAPGYHMAKLIIKLIHSVADVIHSDPVVDGRIRVAFLPDFNVKHSQNVYPAADLSEQISTAGKEASGTGNMKFAMNGALTIGTLDGANVEIREAVGAENFFLFGLTAEEVLRRQAEGYRPREVYESNEALRECLDMLASGAFSHGDRDLFRPLLDSLLTTDPFMLLADYQSYVDCQDLVSQAFRDEQRWLRMSVFNVARVGRFSSDRAVRDYCNHVWRVKVP